MLEKLIWNGAKLIADLLLSIFFVVRTLCRGKRSRLKKEGEKEVVVLGNGPSLNDIDLWKIRKAGIEIACVNSFPIRNEIFWEVKPEYMVLIDPAFFLPYDQLDDESKELYEALKKVDWSVKLVCPQGMEMSLTNTHISVEHIARGRVHNNRIGRYLDWLYQKNLVGIGLQNVVIGAGFYFVGKKVRHLYYAGIDMSEFKQLFVEENNEIYVHCVHNYGETKMKFSDDESMKFHEVLKCYQKMFEQFYYLSCYAERQGVKITNLSCNSYVDVFQKERLFLKEPRMTMD